MLLNNWTIINRKQDFEEGLATIFTREMNNTKSGEVWILKNNINGEIKYIHARNEEDASEKIEKGDFLKYD